MVNPAKPAELMLKAPGILQNWSHPGVTLFQEMTESAMCSHLLPRVASLVLRDFPGSHSQLSLLTVSPSFFCHLIGAQPQIPNSNAGKMPSSSVNFLISKFTDMQDKGPKQLQATCGTGPQSPTIATTGAEEPPFLSHQTNASVCLWNHQPHSLWRLKLNNVLFEVSR